VIFKKGSRSKLEGSSISQQGSGRGQCPIGPAREPGFKNGPNPFHVVVSRPRNNIQGGCPGSTKASDHKVLTAGDSQVQGGFGETVEWWQQFVIMEESCLGEF
jgi:hypothetical protein